MRRPLRWALNGAAAPSAVLFGPASAQEAMTTQPSPPEIPPTPAVANVAFAAACVAFLLLGLALPAPRRRYIVAGGIPAGLLLGMWLDGMTAAGPGCGWIGVPIELIAAGYLGALIRSALQAARRRASAAR